MNDIFDRVARDLHDAAGAIPLARGSELATIRTAHRRRNRNRRAVAAVAVVAVGGGTTVAIQQLGKTSSGDIASSDGEAVAAPVTELQQAVDNAPVNTGPAGSSGSITDRIVPAQLVESSFQWNVVTPDAASAVLGVTDGQVPGIMLSTAPGSAVDGQAAEQAAYYTADGLTFDKVPLDPPTGILRSLYASGDRIYTVGTAPGVAEDSPNPVVVASTADRGATWASYELPIDTHADRDDPWLAVSYMVQTTGVTGSDDVVVLVSRDASLDYTKLPASAQYGFEQTDDGLMVFGDDCLQYPTATTISYGVNGPTATTPDSAASAMAREQAIVDGADCPRELLTWESLGIDAATLAKLGMSDTRAFMIGTDGPVEIALPEGAEHLYPRYGSEGVVDDTNQVRYQIAPDGTFVELPAYPSPQFSDREYATSTTRFVEVYSDAPDGTPTTPMASTTDGVTWAYTDTAALYPEFEMPLRRSGAATDDVFVSAVMGHFDSLAAEGGAEVTKGDVIIRQARSYGDIEYLDATTREPIDRQFIAETEEGITVTDSAGAVRAEFNWDETKMSGSGEFADQVSWYLESTADGFQVALESVADLLSLEDAAISSVSRVTAVGRQAIVAVTLTDTNPDGTPKQVLLVGTPLS